MPYFYSGHGQGRLPPMYWPGQRPPPYQAPWEWDYSANGNPRPRQPAPQGQSPEEDPRVVALQKQVDVILGELQAERAERAKEKEEQRQNERDAALRTEISTVAGKVDSSLQEISGTVRALSEQIQRGNAEGEISRTQQLAEQVGNLTQTIASQREAQLQSTVDALRGELLQVSQRINVEPTGKSTEDLIALGIPILGAKIDNLGNMVGGELQGIRKQAADGKLPVLTPPNPPTPGKAVDPADPVKTAQQISGARAVEDRILAMASGQPRN